MKAIVCDKCGKVTLLEDHKPYMSPSGVYRLVGDSGIYEQEFDLCEDCVGDLRKGLRGMEKT